MTKRGHGDDVAKCDRPRILVVNPNTTASFTDACRVAAALLGDEGLQVTCVNPVSGPPTIEGPLDESLSVEPTVKLLLEKQEEFDAAVVACVSDHAATHAAREALDKPIVGLLEGSAFAALCLGEKFALVTSTPRWEPNLRTGLQKLGLDSRCCCIRGVARSVAELEDVSLAKANVLSMAKKVVEEDDAEVIVLGCAGLSGDLAAEVAEATGCPCVDPVQAAIVHAASLARMRLKTSKRRLYAPTVVSR